MGLETVDCESSLHLPIWFASSGSPKKRRSSHISSLANNEYAYDKAKEAQNNAYQHAACNFK